MPGPRLHHPDCLPTRPAPLAGEGLPDRLPTIREGSRPSPPGAYQLLFCLRQAAENATIRHPREPGNPQHTSLSSCSRHLPDALHRQNCTVPAATWPKLRASVSCDMAASPRWRRQWRSGECRAISWPKIWNAQPSLPLPIPDTRQGHLPLLRMAAGYGKWRWLLWPADRPR
jgi:hypothetical protein